MSTLTAFAVVAASLAAEASITDAQVREAIEESIPYIQEQGVAWIDERDCVSCHRVGTMVWSLERARDRGFQVDEQLDEWTEWAVDASLALNDKGKISGLSNKEGVAQILLAIAEAPGNEVESDVAEQLAELLVQDQEPDGSWLPGGQLPSQKRSKAETTAVTTLWLAMTLAGRSETTGAKEALEKALAYIDASKPARSTEWYAVRALLADRLDDSERAASAVKQLRERQHEDGGWGWLVDEASDALGTGLALYALLKAGVPSDDPAVQRARSFLVTTQRDDGAWDVHGTKAKKRSGVAETAVYWGATWGTLGLLESLPQESPKLATGGTD